jgi:hypothetical protein
MHINKLLLSIIFSSTAGEILQIFPKEWCNKKKFHVYVYKITNIDDRYKITRQYRKSDFVNGNTVYSNKSYYCL